MKYALFLGCTVPIRAQNYELSVRKVAEALGIEFFNIEDFACCGFPVRATSERTTLLLAARNLCVASEQKLDICTLCSACTAVLTEVNNRLIEDISFRREMNREVKYIGREYKEPVKVKHFARILYEEFGMDSIKKKVKRKLNAFKFAGHYGCHYLKPSEIYGGFDDSETPKSLNLLIEATGAIVIDYEAKKLCCGGAILGVEEDISLAMAGRKLEQVKKAGADALVSICPFCSVMYEDNQRRIESKLATAYNLPILFYPQILGLALGLDQKELGFRMNKIKADELLSKLA